MNVTNYPKREKYLKRIKPLIGQPNFVKIFTGPRKVGKTILLRHIMEEIKSVNPEAHIIYVNAEVKKYWNIKDGKDLYQYIHPQITGCTQDKFLFLDELQEIDGYQGALSAFYADKQCDIYCTSSSSNLITGELISYLIGKTLNLAVHPLDYREFMDFHSLENSRETLDKYLHFGGLPALRLVGLSADMAYEFLRLCYYSIMFQGLIGYEKLRNVDSLDFLINYLIENTGSIFTGCNLSSTLKAKKIDIAVPVVINYLKAIANNYFIHKVNRIDFNARIFGRGEKYFFEDLGLRNALANDRQIGQDTHKLIENAVFLSLLYNDYKVFSPKQSDKHVDKELSFMGTREGKRCYIAVETSIADEEKRAKVISNFELVDESSPKYIVTLDDDIVNDDYNGIHHINLRDFLLQEI
ncbi:MAG: ATP-binding protein [Tannerellaceae bacterium]|jgi:predicted AAA+ superfamily ATPase|nr:ATP-binding protein [Tannerellaceae bacterium]